MLAHSMLQTWSIYANQIWHFDKVFTLEEASQTTCEYHRPYLRPYLCFTSYSQLQDCAIKLLNILYGMRFAILI